MSGSSNANNDTNGPLIFSLEMLLEYIPLEKRDQLRNNILNVSFIEFFFSFIQSPENYVQGDSKQKLDLHDKSSDVINRFLSEMGMCSFELSLLSIEGEDFVQSMSEKYKRCPEGVFLPNEWSVPLFDLRFYVFSPIHLYSILYILMRCKSTAVLQLGLHEQYEMDHFNSEKCARFFEKCVIEQDVLDVMKNIQQTCKIYGSYSAGQQNGIDTADLLYFENNNEFTCVNGMNMMIAVKEL